jgi:hypothetical protein
MVTPVDQAVNAWNAEHGDAGDLRALLDAALRELDQLLTVADNLVDTRQPGIGFLTADAAKVMDDTVRKERRDRVEQAKHGIKLTGPIPAPVTVSAVSLIEETERICGEWADNIDARLQRAGVCFIHGQVFTSIGIADAQVGRLLDLVHVVDRRPLLARIHSDVEDLLARHRSLIDGREKAYRLRESCPHCGRNTLVCYPESHLVVCEKDPKTGRYEPCVCDDSYCRCKTTGRHRHEWSREYRGRWSIYGLRDSLNLANRTKKEPTR